MKKRPKRRRPRAVLQLEPLNVLTRRLYTAERELEIQRKNAAAIHWAVTEGRRLL